MHNADGRGTAGGADTDNERLAHSTAHAHFRDVRFAVRSIRRHPPVLPATTSQLDSSATRLGSGSHRKLLHFRFVTRECDRPASPLWDAVSCLRRAVLVIRRR